MTCAGEWRVDTWGIGSEGVAEGISTGQLGSRTCCQRDFHRTFGVENVLPNHTGGGGVACGFSVGKALRTPVGRGLLVGFRLARHCAHRCGGGLLVGFRLARHCAHRRGGLLVGFFGWQGIAHTGGRGGFRVGKASGEPVGGVCSCGGNLRKCQKQTRPGVFCCRKSAN